MKQRAHYRRAVLAAAVALWAIAAVRAQPVPSVRGIWISPPSSTAVIPSVVRTLDAAGLNMVVMPVFYDGRAVYPSRIFPQHDAYVGSDPAALLTRETHRRGMRAVAALDLLYWQSSGSPSPAVSSHPQWLERTAEGRIIGDEPGRPGAFVSPAEPRVKSLLVELVSELASRYDFDGVVLDFARWSRVDFLGYADADRKLYLDERRTDPLDVDLFGYATPDNLVQALVGWQEARITEVAQAAAQAFARGEPTGVVLAVVEPAYYDNRTADPVRQDWRTWVSQGWAKHMLPRGIRYRDPVRARAQIRAAFGSEQPAAMALIEPTAGLSAREQMAVVAEIELPGFVLWARDSLDQRRAILRELGAW